MAFIKGEKIEFEYSLQYQGEENLFFKALDCVDIEIEKGEFVCILGHNGSGKSTLARHFNALLTPTKNSIWIDGINSKDTDKVWDIRKKVGIVFQNPDNQIIGTTVSSDVAFGLENLGISTNEMLRRVDDVLTSMDMINYKDCMPENLSGGQKQKVAISGILAMKPDCIVFDEATSMLDPMARDEVLKIMKNLNHKHKITVILITHHMEEVIFSDRVIVMEKGKVALECTPESLFSHYEKLKSLKLDLPQVTKLSYMLNELGYNVKKNCLDLDEILAEIEKVGFNENFEDDSIESLKSAKFDNFEVKKDKEEIKVESDINKDRETEEIESTKENFNAKAQEFSEILQLKNLNYVYSKGTVFEKKALDNINLSIKKGEILGVVGHTGSGKSTLIQHLNMLIKPQPDTLFFYGDDVTFGKVKPREIRQRVGLVFQYPESQLFEETVFKEVAFAPRNMHLSEDEVYYRVKNSLSFVGMGESFFEKNPFSLSGGQKRCVAIASILAMNPEVIILDEPTAGLDPVTKNFILQNIRNINESTGVTVIFISHSMEDICNFADRVAIMHKGKLQICEKPENIFNNVKKIKEMGLKLPQVTELFFRLNEKFQNVPLNVINLEQAIEFFSENLKK